jgi:hypothetical protein
MVCSPKALLEGAAVTSARPVAPVDGGTSGVEAVLPATVA